MKTKTATFESALKKLEETVEKLEEGTIPLNEALTTFESGVHWSRECKKFLDNA
nr:exodeoxyribonuclease VII small subunit [SAR324 cluster bacterium]